MPCRLLSATVFLIAFSALASAQDVNPAQNPDVLLQNHMPDNKKQKAPTSRTISGKVVDEGGQPLQGALVILTNLKTKEKTTYITKKEGAYRFEDLSFNIDYQIQAHYKDGTSDPRKLSQYDHTAAVVRILEIQPEQSESAPAATAKENTSTTGGSSSSR